MSDTRFGTCLTIEVLFAPSCPHVGALPGRIEALARDEGLEVVVTETVLDDLAAAEARRFTGSPTILVEARTTADPDYGSGPAHGDDMFESNGFVVHYFSRALVERLAHGFDLLEVAEFEEGDLPRRLFRVAQRRAVALQ